MVGDSSATSHREDLAGIELDLWVIIKLASARSIAECIYCICKSCLGSEVCKGGLSAAINQAELGVGPGRIELLDSKIHFASLQYRD